MKKIKKIMFVTSLVFWGSFFVGCDDEYPDYYQEREFDLENFKGVNLGDAFQIEIEQSEDFYVMAKGEERDLNNLLLEVEDGILVGSYQPGSSNHKRTLLQIYMPVLRSASLRDASSSRITGFNNPEESLELKASGASRVIITSDWKSLDVEVNGASEVIIEGSAEDLEAEINGASRLQAIELLTDITLVELAGASEASVTASDQLSGEVNGHSLLRYGGNPESIDVKVAIDSRMMRY